MLGLFPQLSAANALVPRQHTSPKTKSTKLETCQKLGRWSAELIRARWLSRGNQVGRTWLPPPCLSGEMADQGLGIQFKLNIPPPEDVAEVDDNMESIFPHTPRHDSAWFDNEPSAELVEQCLRPGRGSEALPEPARDWMHRKLAAAGHAANEHGDFLMAQTWFECAYASKSNIADLISAANMRLKLGQWSLVEQLYKNIMRMELNQEQRAVRAISHANNTHRSCACPYTAACSPLCCADLRAQAWRRGRPQGRERATAWDQPTGAAQLRGRARGAARSACLAACGEGPGD